MLILSQKKLAAYFISKEALSSERKLHSMRSKTEIVEKKNKLVSFLKTPSALHSPIEAVAILGGSAFTNTNRWEGRRHPSILGLLDKQVDADLKQQASTKLYRRNRGHTGIFFSFATGELDEGDMGKNVAA